jgi:hypothetical protein
MSEEALTLFIGALLSQNRGREKTVEKNATMLHHDMFASTQRKGVTCDALTLCKRTSDKDNVLILFPLR